MIADRLRYWLWASYDLIHLAAFGTTWSVRRFAESDYLIVVTNLDPQCSDEKQRWSYLAQQCLENIS
jgi:hypothetical protein